MNITFRLFSHQPTLRRSSNRLRFPLILASAILLAFCAIWLHGAIVRAETMPADPALDGISAAELPDVAGRGSLSGNPSLQAMSSSIDGRFWVFSSADPLTKGDTNHQRDVYLYDRFNDQMELVSSSREGLPADGESAAPAVSTDGRWVVFSSNATNLVDVAVEGRWNVYRKDRQNGEIRLVSGSENGEPANGNSYYPTVSGDGSKVAFVSYADNLVMADNNGEADIFLSDLSTGELRIISRSSRGILGNDASTQPALNAAGDALVFVSKADNLLPGMSGSTGEDVYLYDIANDTLSLVSLTRDGRAANGSSWVPSLSADGKRVAFASYASNLTDEDANGVADVFLYDRETKEMRRVSKAPDGGEFLLMSWHPALTSDGRYVRFESCRSGLADETDPVLSNAYLYDSMTDHVRAVADEPDNPALTDKIPQNGELVHQ